MRHATRICFLSLSLSIERSRDRQETKETSDGMPRKNIGSSRTNIICRLLNMKKVGILKVHSFCLPQGAKESLNSKRRISESLFILKMFRRRDIKTIILSERICCFFLKEMLDFNRREIFRTFVKGKRNNLIFNEKAKIIIELPQPIDLYTDI